MRLKPRINRRQPQAQTVKTERRTAVYHPQNNLNNNF